MSWVINSRSSRRMIVFGMVMAVMAIALVVVSQQNAVEAVSKGSGDQLGTTTFPGTGTGAIPDGVTCGTYNATTRVVSFNVTGIAGPPTDVDVSITVGHTWVGDVRAVLAAPNGTTHTIFESTGGAATAGDSSNLVGPYVFDDSAAGNWWTAAAGVPDISPVPAGSYRTSNNTGAQTVMNAAFAGIPTSTGTWTLTFADRCPADTGSVTAASLTLDGGGPVAPVQNVIDFNADGRTDFAVVRNTGGGASGQITWFVNLNGPGTTGAVAWGIASDFFVPNDYDGDNRTDIAIWRAEAAGTAGFYILRSSNSTFQFQQFGQTGDDPTVVGDYDGDGLADVAVYRAGAAAGQQSTWFYRRTLTNPGGNTTFVPWGQNGDFVAPGDYDGDGRADFVVQRNGGGGQAIFWRLQTTAGVDSIFFGTPTDVVVPGDYDGDGRTDLAVTRGVGGSLNWFVRPSSTGVISAAPFAVFGTSATDFQTQGDYDGDGRTDAAVWRPNADPTQNFFFFLGSTSGFAQSEWGQNGDYPVANYNVH